MAAFITWKKLNTVLSLGLSLIGMMTVMQYLANLIGGRPHSANNLQEQEQSGEYNSQSLVPNVDRDKSFLVILIVSSDRRERLTFDKRFVKHGYDYFDLFFGEYNSQSLVLNVDREESFLVILIVSSDRPGAADVRRTIRETWRRLIPKNEDIVYRFVIGAAEMTADRIQKLSTTESDLAFIMEAQDDYYHLTQKSLFGFKWFHDNFKFRYLLKVDDDSFVVISELLKLLQGLSDPRRQYIGYFDGRARVRKTGKWAEAKWDLCDRYLPHALGGGYILSYDLVEFLAQNAKLFRTYANEDKAVGAWLAGLDVSYTHSARFDTEYASRGCQNDYIVTHKQSPDDLRKLYYNLVNLGTICTEERAVRPSYEYNWLVPPSKCCGER